MQAVILAGGLGTRISEETQTKPKPMVEVGGRPILWHILKLYAAYGIHDFVICLGFKGFLIKEYFANYGLHSCNLTIELARGDIRIHSNEAEDWRVTLIDTGLDTQTGGRLKRVGDYIEEDTFCMTYGDGVANIDIGALIEFHRAHGRQATVTATQQPGRFGALRLDGDAGDAVVAFQEKPGGDAWINGGFFVLSKSTLDLVDGDQTVWEREPLERLAAADQLRAYKHRGFWQPMDTLREKLYLDQLWESGAAPWKVWA
jgi:glucose-1-phosphate cytidylyltransferase